MKKGFRINGRWIWIRIGPPKKRRFRFINKRRRMDYVRMRRLS